MGRDGMRFTNPNPNPNPIPYMQMEWKNVPVPFLYLFWDKNMSQSRPKRDEIMWDPIPKEMGSCGIPSQLEKFPFLIGNETGWEGICQSHSRHAYAIGIKKKCLTPIPKFFYRTKICFNPILKGMGSRRISSHQKKLSSLLVMLKFLIHFIEQLHFIFCW